MMKRAFYLLGKHLPLYLLFIAITLTTTSGSEKEGLVLPGLIGVSLAEYQNSGSEHLPNCQWTAWENTDRKGKPTIHNHQKSGASCDHWNRYKEDVQLIKEVGCNACRFSLDWSKIEPKKGVFDQAAINHYHDEIDEMLKNNITPMATMHHFVHPQWFEELNAFERVENIYYFKRFCTKIFEEFGGKIKLWCTINEPGPYAFQSYINKAFPPGLSHLQTAGTVLRNLLLAHILVYRTLKATPHGKTAQIGLVHQYLSFESYHKNNIIEQMPVNFLNYVFNEVILHFLKTGEFSFKIPTPLPLIANVYIPKKIKQMFPQLELEKRPYFDFIGLNFYSRVVIKQQHWNPFKKDAVVPACRDGETMTDMPYPRYAQGLYRAIHEMSCFNVPIYITENGISDVDDKQRSAFFEEYLGVLSETCKAGYDVRGWFYWSLMDNFEWNDGFDQHFGLYEVDLATQKRTMRPSVQTLQKIIQDSMQVSMA